MPRDGSLLELIHTAAPYRPWIVAALVALPLVTWGAGLVLRRMSRRGAAIFLSVPIHLAVIPGVAMALTLGYVLFFVRGNVLAELDAVLVLGPVASMGFTLLAASRVMRFEEIPGFDRLSGLMLLSALAFALAYLIYRLAFRVFFFSPLITLVLLFVAAFAGLRFAGRRAFGAR